VIAEVDEALCRALARALPKGTVVRLDPPKPTWQTEKPSQAVDLFLYGIAQDASRTEAGWDEERDARGVVISRTERPRRYLLTYLVTARAPKIAEEHELLDCALHALVDHEALPTACLPDTLAALEMPVLTKLDTAGPGELWTNLGMPARAAFVLIVSAPYRMQPDLEIGPPADKIDLRTHDIHRRPATPAPSGDSEPPAAPTPARPGMQPVQKRWIRVYPDREDQPTKKK
jgi:hypothetical protein